ncbi:MAG: saccharopine dehydrogenase NADP-binding domain-containing protein [Bacteroidetes bacterium]|nr:saccharopine dehydrogenase NADP-binding domain-containing protein [Bacteroidota bacterium]
MKNVLILGAGQSAPHLISYMLKNAEEHNWFVTVCDMNLELAQKRIQNHPKGKALFLDATDEDVRNSLIEKSDIVINFLAPMFQYPIVLECLKYGKHFVSASYEDPKVAALNNEIKAKGILVLNEMGLDPGIDHMSAVKLINEIKSSGGKIKSFISYGSALPAPEVKSNPLDYCMTWNPRNVALAGQAGAHYLQNAKHKILSYNQVFERTWQYEVQGLGTLEAYPNRDSVVYKEIFEIPEADTMIRATLRNPGWCGTWNQIVKLGMANESMRVTNLAEKTYAEFTEMFLPNNLKGKTVAERTSDFLGIEETSKEMENLKYFGIFSEEKIGGSPKCANDVLTQILINKLPLPKGARDMVILAHEIVCEYPAKNKKEKITSTYVDYGDDEIYTAISKTVGLPAAIGAKLILTGELNINGTYIPTHPVIYTKVLEELKTVGIKFIEKKEEL